MNSFVSVALIGAGVIVAILALIYIAKRLTAAAVHRIRQDLYPAPGEVEARKKEKKAGGG